MLHPPCTKCVCAPPIAPPAPRPPPPLMRRLTHRLAYLREGELMFMSRSRVRRGDIRVMGAPTHPLLCRRAQEKCCEMTAEGEGEGRTGAGVGGADGCGGGGVLGERTSSSFTSAWPPSGEADICAPSELSRDERSAIYIDLPQVAWLRSAAVGLHTVSRPANLIRRRRHFLRAGDSQNSANKQQNTTAFPKKKKQQPV